MKKHIGAACLALLAITAGCSPSLENDTARKGVSATVTPFLITYAGEVKTTLVNSDNAIYFQWAKDDEIGVVPTDGATYQTNYTVDEMEPDRAWFDGGAWNLKDGYSYLAYYPCPHDRTVTSASTVPLSVVGQVQSANASTAHLGNFDFLYAQPQRYDNGRLSFNFEHIGSLLRIRLTTATAGTFSSMAISTTGGYFVSQAGLSLPDGSISEERTTSSISLSLGNIYVAKGGVLELWMAVLPSEGITGKDFKISFTRTSGSKLNFTGTGFSISSGRILSLNMSEPSDPYEQYNKWLGTWNDSNGASYTVTAKEKGSTYNIAGFDIYDGLTAEGIFDSATGKMLLCGQDMGSDEEYYYILAGIDSEDYVELGDPSNELLLAIGTVSSDGKTASFAGNEYDATYGGTLYHEKIVTVELFGIDGNNYYTFSGNPTLYMGGTLTKATANASSGQGGTAKDDSIKMRRKP